MKPSPTVTSQQILDRLEEFIEKAVQANGGDTTPVDPGHRIPFHWPPHAISHDYHVEASSFNEKHPLPYRGEILECTLARTPFGIFGRVEGHWNEARGETVDQVLKQLAEGVAPWFDRMDAITQTLGRPERYHGHLDDLSPDELILLLYCPVRDVAHHALVEIEKYASSHLFTEPLVRILNDTRHPYRRTAQWCTLDMFEDIGAFCSTEEEIQTVVDAIKDLIWRANDDYARTVFKAGGVLGGHISNNASTDALLACFQAPSRIGRRSAIHASFHLAEWLPSRKSDIVQRLRESSRNDEDPQLREFAAHMAQDIDNGAEDHVDEPVFPGENR